MNNKSLPFTQTELVAITSHHATPFHIYDETAIRQNARKLTSAYAWNKGFREYFAVKALPNPAILQILKEEGFGADCSSLAELILAERVGLRGEQIMFTSNDTSAEEFKKARELGAIINLDDISHITYLEEQAGMPDLLSFRYNPGSLKNGNAVIGKPEQAKYGLTRSQLFEAYQLAQTKGVKRFGLHTMVASNELNPAYFIETAEMLFQLIQELHEKLGIQFEFVNMGGGIGIPYRPEQRPVDIETISHGVRMAYQRYIIDAGLRPLRLYIECGRFITGPYGYLVSTVLHKKNTYKEYIGLDASMANLMRPGMYGAYHHISIVGKETATHGHTYDITGSLCENNDKFAIDRELPEITIGDTVIIHDTGAHGHSMGFNYNGKLRSAELLLKPTGEVQVIRRAETLDDLFATLEV